MSKSKHVSAAELADALRARMENRGEVVITVTGNGVTRVQANTSTEEAGRESVSLYHKILLAIHALDARATADGKPRR